MPQPQTQLSRERARVRDLLRYYKPTVKRTASATEKKDSFLTAFDDGSSEPVPFDVAAIPDEIPDDPTLAHDPTLTAFAQLGCFRLDCERSFISLMDHDTQYIIAEATRSVSLNDPEKSEEGDNLYLGARMLDLVWGVCPHAIQVFTAKDDSLNVTEQHYTINQKVHIMNDMSAIERFKTRPYVAGWPHMRFYAEVPIHSPTGHVIGTYCVVDNRTRDVLDQKGLDALNEIAAAIMKHLELVQMQHSLQRASGMVKGLGLFVEGNSDDEQWWDTENGGHKNDLRNINERPSGHRTGTVQTIPTLSERRPDKEEPTPDSLTTASSEPKVSSKPTAETPRPTSQKTFSSDGGMHPRERKLSMDATPSFQDSPSSTGTKLLFSRASTLAREAIELDGIMFVDACFRDIAVDPTQPARRSSSDFVRFKGMPETPEYDQDEWLGDPMRMTTEPSSSTHAAFVRPDTNSTHSYPSSTDVLGYSMRDGLGYEPASGSLQSIPLPQSTLRGLLRHYRQGLIFFFEEDGSLSQIDKPTLRGATQSKFVTGSVTIRESDREREKTWARQLISICRGARAIIFFPLWDPQRDQWFAGSLAWTNDPMRNLQLEDIPYLTAFGSCIMAEKSRLDALTADRAKADFISSVSHELRSPLHGILASAEALQETSTGFAQDDMIRTITVCGEVLLDTMDQILDYAKMSNATNPSQSNNGKASSTGPQNKDTSVDLSSLVESVVEGIFAGHNLRRTALESVDDKGSKSYTSTISSRSGDVMVIISIDRQDSWVFESQIGGWKRILMNLFGNSLKYTESGFIHISLRANKSRRLPDQTTVTLQVDDSGKGMSKDYLKYQLYTPFAQEDPMSVGTGLGLSIVRQLVTDLKGTIDIQSEVAYGTAVRVDVPLTISPEILEVSPSNASIVSKTRERCKGFILCLIGFEYYPDIGEAPTGILTAPARRMLALKSSITSFAADWFCLEITTAASLDSAKGDVLMGLQSKLDLGFRATNERPLIVLDDTAETRLPNGNGIFSLQQPVGPHKLARILVQCLEYISSVQKLKVAEAAYSLGNVSGLPQNDLVALVEDIKQESNDALLTLSTTPRATVLPHPAPTIPVDLKAEEEQVIPGDPKPEDQLNVDHVAQKLQKTSITTTITTSIVEIPPRSRVLLVEDNIINMKILINYMKKASQPYLTAANGLEALNHYTSSPSSFKVIFMDISMPVMDGLTSTKKIRIYERESNLEKTRIVALTCFSSQEYQRDARVSGVDMFLIKPVPMKTLQPILEGSVEWEGG